MPTSPHQALHLHCYYYFFRNVSVAKILKEVVKRGAFITKHIVQLPDSEAGGCSIPPKEKL